MLDGEVLYCGCKELQTCSMDDGCQSGSLHGITISRVLDPGGSRKSDAGEVVIELHTCSASYFLSLGVQLVNWASRGVLKLI